MAVMRGTMVWQLVMRRELWHGSYEGTYGMAVMRGTMVWQL